MPCVLHEIRISEGLTSEVLQSSRYTILWSEAMGSHFVVLAGLELSVKQIYLHQPPECQIKRMSYQNQSETLFSVRYTFILF